EISRGAVRKANVYAFELHERAVDVEQSGFASLLVSADLDAVLHALLRLQRAVAGHAEHDHIGAGENLADRALVILGPEEDAILLEPLPIDALVFGRIGILALDSRRFAERWRA